MDQLTQIQLERLQRCANVAANANWEGDVSGLAFALIRYSGLDIDNGYIVTSENHINNTDLRRMDIIVQILRGRERVLIIECKKDTTYPTRDKQQLFGYMQDERFPHGMLMYPTRTMIFELDVQQNDAEVQALRIFDSITEIEDILQAMFEMRVLDKEDN